MPDMTQAQKLFSHGPEAIARFFKEQRKNGEPCEYGHFGCSNMEGAACSDELLYLTEGDQDD